MNDRRSRAAPSCSSLRPPLVPTHRGTGIRIPRTQRPSGKRVTLTIVFELVVSHEPVPQLRVEFSKR